MTYAYDEVALECEFAQCRTFGSVIRFALDLEKVSTAYYQDAAKNNLVKGPAVELFVSLTEHHKKREELLLHTRREKLNEMILEPIDNIKNEMHKPVLKKLDDLDDKGLIDQAIELEEKSASFYITAATEAQSLLAEVSRIFMKIGKENTDNVLKLKAL